MTQAGGRLDPAAVRRTLKAAGLRARRSMSQNFLVDVDVLEAILAEARPRPGGRIVEIGPGLGVLTEALLGEGAAVIAIELDPGMVAFLRERLADALETGRDPEAAGGLRLIQGDALDQDLRSLAGSASDVVANIPYHVTSPILHRLLEAPPRPRRIVLMVQREVAERIAAGPGAMSYLAVFCQYHARVRMGMIVPPIAFEPAPSVDSAIVVLEPYGQGDPDAPPRLGMVREGELWRLVMAGFRERRKMLHNVLRRQLPALAARVPAALAESDIDGERRPQTLSVGEWIRLLDALYEPADQRRGRS